MKLNKAAMIKMIDDIEAAAVKEQEAWTEIVKAYQEQELTKWQEREFPKFVALRDLLTTKIKSKKPITTAEIRVLGFDDRYNGLNVQASTYSRNVPSQIVVGSKKITSPRAVDNNLLELRSALALIEDAEISYSALQQLGFRNMGWFFKQAALAAKAASEA